MVAKFSTDADSYLNLLPAFWDVTIPVTPVAVALWHLLESRRKTRRYAVRKTLWSKEWIGLDESGTICGKGVDIRPARPTRYLFASSMRPRAYTHGKYNWHLGLLPTHFLSF